MAIPTAAMGGKYALDQNPDVECLTCLTAVPDLSHDEEVVHVNLDD